MKHSCYSCNNANVTAQECKEGLPFHGVSDASECPLFTLYSSQNRYQKVHKPVTLDTFGFKLGIEVSTKTTCKIIA